MCPSFMAATDTINLMATSHLFKRISLMLDFHHQICYDNGEIDLDKI